MSSSQVTPSTMSRLLSRQVVADRTIALSFEKPEGWKFQAGQFLELTLPAPSETDAEGNARTFTIASAPREETLMIATRLRDTAFKREVAKMPLGTPVAIGGPWGDLTLDPGTDRSAVFLAGGIGITPFRSMAFAAAHEKLTQRLFLFYSNRRPEDAPFLEELQALEKVNPNYKLIASMTKMEKSHLPWHGETGLIDQRMLARHLKDAVSPGYYIAGPPEMVQTLGTMLRKSGIPEADIRAEEFSGY